MSQAVSLIGHQVSWVAADGTSGTGTASKVSISNGAIQISVGDSQVTPDEIVQVA
jgi:hypothetical protein